MPFGWVLRLARLPLGSKFATCARLHVLGRRIVEAFEIAPWRDPSVPNAPR